MKPLIHPTNDFNLDETKELLLGPQNIDLDRIIIDNTAIERTTGKETNNEKKIYSYNESLERLRKYGYERHLRPNEAFKIIIDALEHPESNYKEIYKDMMSSFGEWLSLAIERDKDFLICYLDPEGIIFEDNNYNTTNISFADKIKIYIGDGIQSNDWVSLKEFPKDFTSFLLSKTFFDLPDKMKIGENEIRIYLPENGIWPVAYRHLDLAYNVIEYSKHAASRGLRKYARSINNR